MIMDNFLPFDTVSLDEDGGAIVIIDQTRLPNSIEYLRLKDQQEIWYAIKTLQVRGAPAIGVCAAFGAYLAARNSAAAGYAGLLSDFKRAMEYLNSARPTAVNLSWALKRMYGCLIKNESRPIPEIVDCLRTEALAIREEDIAVCRSIGEHGVKLLHDGCGILTHCNAGMLGTVRYGTATAPVYVAHERGMHIRVYADETRPLLQGARLTAFELQSAGIDVTLQCDNMASWTMGKGLIDIVLVGCDRVAMNGDVANKIGTSLVAIAAKHYGIPFYVCAPTSTIDPMCRSGDEIVIEQRPAEEVTELWYKERIAPEGVKVLNPAFDVTDHTLISGIITEYGILYPPYETSLRGGALEQGRSRY